MHGLLLLQIPTAGDMIEMWKKNHNLFGIFYGWFLAKARAYSTLCPCLSFLSFSFICNGKKIIRVLYFLDLVVVLKLHTKLSIGLVTF